MRLTSTIAGTVALLVTSAIPALADDTTGTVTKIDATSITLDSGQTFSLAVDLTPMIKVGQKVTVAFASVDGRLKASSVMPYSGNTAGSPRTTGDGQPNGSATPAAGNPPGTPD